MPYLDGMGYTYKRTGPKNCKPNQTLVDMNAYVIYYQGIPSKPNRNTTKHPAWKATFSFPLWLGVVTYFTRIYFKALKALKPVNVKDGRNEPNLFWGVESFVCKAKHCTTRQTKNNAAAGRQGFAGLPNHFPYEGL